MTTRWISLVIAVTLVFVAAMGCSGNGSPIAPPSETDAKVGQSGAGKTLPIGLYQFIVNKNTKEVDIITLRGAGTTLNVLGFMEPPALVNLSIDFGTLAIEPDNDYIGVDVIFRHPFVTQNGDFMGFDVRGVVFGPQITNADGYSPLVNPADFTGVPFGYQDGLLGSPNSTAHFDEEYWGYKYFADGLDEDEDLTEWIVDNLEDRGKFSEGKTNSRHYDLSWAGTGYPYDFFVFNYAVMANFDWPTGDPPYDLSSFNISTANMAEAFAFDAFEISNTLFFDGDEGGGDLDIDIEIFDWQGTADTEVTIESIEPGVITPVTVTTSDPGITPHSGIFHFVDVQGSPTQSDDLEILITATDTSETYGSSWFLGLLPTGNDFYNTDVYTLFKTTVEVGIGDADWGWFPIDGMTGKNLAPAPNQGARDADLGVFSAGANQSRGTTLSQTGDLFYEWNNAYSAPDDTYPWLFGPIMDDFNRFDVTLDGGKNQVISHDQSHIGTPPDDGPISCLAVLVDTDDGYLPGPTGDYVWILQGFDPTAYWLDLGDTSAAIIGHDDSPNGADNNIYFIGSHSTAPDNPGAHDYMYQFYRWLSPYYTESTDTLHLTQIGVYGMSIQHPTTPGPIDDNDARENRLGVDDNSGTYFIDPPHPETDYAEFLYILDNRDYVHMIIMEYDDPIAVVYVAGATDENWEGDAVDVTVAPAYDYTWWAPWGFCCVLIDKGDNTWTVQTLFWDISQDPLVVYMLYETDPLPGSPLAIDVDNTDFELHVLADVGGAKQVTVFEWEDIPEE